MPHPALSCMYILSTVMYAAYRKLT